MSDELATAIVAALAVIFGQFVIWLTTRNKDRGQLGLSQAELDEKRRSGDLDTIITTLQAELTRALLRLTEVERQNQECWADREMMRQAMGRLQLKVDRMEQRQQRAN